MLAGIVATVDGSDAAPWVVSLGTGSKCCGPCAIDEGGGGKVLHDSHAEVLARRGFVHAVLEEMRGGKPARPGWGLLARGVGEEEGSFSLREGVRFHLYVSESPCGDAAIYPAKKEGAAGEGDGGDSR